MFVQIFSENHRILLEQLGRNELLKPYYLAGGTAAALYLGHRISEDFDFFTPHPIQQEEIVQFLKTLGTLEIVSRTRGSLHCLLNNIKLSFLYYDYPLLKPEKNELGVRIASLTDISLMKITAIAGRGSKKDFIDLYFISHNHLSLDELFALLPKKYSEIKRNLYHIIKSLSFFEDAEKEPAPFMLKVMNWEEIKSYFVKKEKEMFILFLKNYSE